VWQREQGLPQNSVRALAQTRDGYLWVGNDDGIARFDGIRFVSFGLREGLRSGSVRVLFEDRHAALWVGTTGGGLTRLRDNEVTTFATQDGLPSETVTALAEDEAGQLWVGTSAGLVLYSKGKFSALSAADELRGKPITALFKDRHGMMWLGATGAGVFHFSGGRFVRVTESAVESLLLEPHCLLVDKAGRLWVGAGDDYVLCLENTDWRRFRISRHLARPHISALAEEPDGTVWAGSVSEGLFRFKSGKLLPVNASSGLSDNLVEALLVDREGNLWVGTGAGLNRIRRSSLSVFGQNDGLGYGSVHGLAEVAPGIIWAAKRGDGLYRWEGGNFKRMSGEDAWRNYPEVNSLLAVKDGSCWATDARGLLRFAEPKAALCEATQAGLAGLNVVSLCEDRDGGVWAGTREGDLWRLQNGSWTQRPNFALVCAITAIAQAGDGSLWIGTEGRGLYQYRGEIRSHFDRSNGLLSNLIRALHIDAQGAIWIGTAGGGLSRWHEGRLATFTTREGLPDNTISQILEDNSGRLWFGSNRGIACIAKQELDELAAGKISSVYAQSFGRAEGMLSEECTTGFCPAGLKTRSGLLWFSTLKGVVVVDPRPQATEAPPPPVVLEEVMVDGTAGKVTAERAGWWTATNHPQARQRDAGTQSAEAPDAEPALLLAPGKHRLEFHYTGLSFSAPERVRFRYRLERLDADWMDAGTRRTAYYAFVPPGEYRFRVAASTGSGTWNEASPALALVVRPHIWQTKWATVLAVAVLLLIAGGGVGMVEKRKHQRRLKRLEAERALEQERARIAQDLHDDLGSSLTRISLLSDLLKTEKENSAHVDVHATKISQSAAQTVRALEEIVWALRPGSDFLQSLVDYIAHFASELFEGDVTRCRLDLPHDVPQISLPPEMRHNVFLIVKEALTNSFKHAAAREVHVQAKASADALEITVQDDGRGFQTQGPSPKPGKHHGLGNMQRRTQAIGGVLTVEAAPGKGTKIKLVVPLCKSKSQL
jgi:ligand-binding sensor domain-containing protein/signal transduction histidine kinase